MQDCRALSTQDSGLSTQHSALRTQDSALTQDSGLRTQHSGLRTQHSALYMPRCILALVIMVAAPLNAATTITLLHFSDYHSHALPFYSEDRPDQGGIARAIRYMQEEKRRGALVFSGGDMVNQGSPAWSDKYRCAEWAWLNGLVDAMALGNHDPDYGSADFARCRGEARYPILSANTAGFQQYDVFTRRGIRIGVFAVAGPDFATLVKAAGFTFSDRVAAAREIVRTLRDEEHVAAVVLIGHEHLDDDFALARAVPGIDVVFGTHSHLLRDWMRIPGTSTWFISPSQYLTYVSRVELTFDHQTLMGARGRLVRVDASLPADPAIAGRVEAMERDLERDPHYAPLFVVIGQVPQAMPVDELAHFTLETVRKAANADVALSTASSFRQPLPAGALTMEQLRAALPYDNEVLVYEMSGEQLASVLAYSASRAGTDSTSYVVGADPLDRNRTYHVATTDYLARVAPGYREIFASLTPRKPGLHVRDLVQQALK
jgi:5'-nucleotidase/UDP-sugar diphosphatase